MKNKSLVRRNNPRKLFEEKGKKPFIGNFQTTYLFLKLKRGKQMNEERVSPRYVYPFYASIQRIVKFYSTYPH